MLLGIQYNNHKQLRPYKLLNIMNLKLDVGIILQKCLNTGMITQKLTTYLFHGLTLTFLGCMSLFIGGCASYSPENFYKTAKQLKLEKIIIKGKTFPMIYYTKGIKQNTENLHIYLGGDGTPWLDIMTYSVDPTPSNPMILKLMDMDNSTSLFLGRPCYQGLSKTPPCDYYYWTAGRYSPAVLANMREAIMKLINKYQVKNLTLIGFSGGGALATLLANDIPQSNTVVTIAGLLDTDAWTDLHFYSPLSGSLNPAKQAPLAKHIQQIHLLGDNDKNIPPEIVSVYLNKQSNAEVLHFKQADHNCCWKKHWPMVLKKINNPSSIPEK